MPVIPSPLAFAEQLPDTCDWISVSYRGVRFHVYGFLHGVTGAGNHVYREFIQRSINQARGLKFAEKGLDVVYSGIDVDLEDWAAMPLADSASLLLRLSIDPKGAFSLAKTTVMELFRRRSDRHAVGDLRGFHSLLPTERRRQVGFPEPESYLRINLDRRQGFPHPGIRVPDKDWLWLTTIEPAVNIPLRSLHMLEFAAEYAKADAVTEASLFVGEIHNTDMLWLADMLTTDGIAGLWTVKDLAIIKSVRARARKLARRAAEGYTLNYARLPYALSLFAGGTPLVILLIAAYFGYLWRW